MLAKLTDIKRILNASESGMDDLLTQLLDAATARAEQLVGRPLRRAETQEKHRQQRAAWLLTLRLAPIETVSSVSVDGRALIEDADYLVRHRDGWLEALAHVWPAGSVIAVHYVGGFVDPNLPAPPDTAIQPPLDLQQGIIQEALRLYNRGRQAGLTGVHAGAGGGGSFNDNDVAPELKAAALALRRMV